VRLRLNQNAIENLQEPLQVSLKLILGRQRIGLVLSRVRSRELVPEPELALCAEVNLRD
jgi:hypothetical protein